jgi:transcription elongation factor GreB
VREAPAGDRAFFGAWVRIAREDGVEAEYRIVGADETDAASHHISVDSPLARALLKRAAGDEVEVALERGVERYTILAVRYG